MTDDVQIAVIGAGPSGIAAAAALNRAGLSTLVLDRGALGETLFRMPPGMRFFSSPENLSYFGIPVPAASDRCTREEYLFYIRQIADHFQVRTRCFENVVGITGKAGHFVLNTTTLTGVDRTCQAERIVLATGDCILPHLLGIPGEDLPHVSHFMQDPARYTRRRVLVVGGRNSAAEACLRLYHAGAEVFLSCRSKEFDKAIIKYWIYPELSGLIKKGAIQASFGSALLRINAETAVMESPQGRREVEAEDVLLMTGYEPDLTLFTAVGIELSGDSRIPLHDKVTLETNVPGVHVCGTAVAGFQSNFAVFIENTRHHPDLLAKALSLSLSSAKA